MTSIVVLFSVIVLKNGLFTQEAVLFAELWAQKCLSPPHPPTPQKKAKKNILSIKDTRADIV
jgi:hypothetical protein